MARVSICVPTYNNPECVRQLLESVRQQTYTDYAVFCSDDSTDGRIEKLMTEFADLPITYVHNEKPLGHIFNWNAALDMADGEYIKIMFSDDWFTDENSLQKFVELLDQNPEASLVYSGSMQVSAKRSYARAASDNFLQKMKKDWRYLLARNEFGAPSAVMVRGNDARFDEKSNWASDVFYYFEVLSRGGAAVGTKEPLVSIGEHEEQYTQTFTTQDERKYQDYLWMYRKYGLDRDKNCRKLFLDHYQMWYHRSWKETKEQGFSFGEYLTARMKFLWEKQILCILQSRTKKLVRAVLLR